MLDATATAIITGAAGNIVAYMLNGRIDELRSWATRTFRRGTEDQRRASLEALTQDSAALTHGQMSQAEIKSRWAAVLAAYLTSHPEAQADIDSMASEGGTVKSVKIGSQHNHGSGVFIGGDNFGGIGSRESE
ncbi:hypothetical protein [Micromonospora ureilytica]|uniref:Uncharacterized protein n=1 Tax=Micromonospora ureilytica TaxID=709868 RepID=A0ABS0JSE5_9ACTN|nr:hypothetical protein [Micromonospora ureilytica]MBG6069386.1 hypothetical protein [Micromonospora ureilytica]